MQVLPLALPVLLFKNARRYRERTRKKLDAIRAAGIDPYPARVKAFVRYCARYRKFRSARKYRRNKISLAGRIQSLRDQGKIIFIDIVDETGKIQLVLKDENLKDIEFWRSVLDLGDFISATGLLFTTKRGEKSVEVVELAIASKSLLPLPDNWAGLEDEEVRLRKRHLDLIANRGAARTVQKENDLLGYVP